MHQPSLIDEGPKAAATTPMMAQYLRAKKEQPGAPLFFRMGDFYELFGEDAVTASRELGITLSPWPGCRSRPTRPT